MHKLFKFTHIYSYSLLVGFMAIVQVSLVPAQNNLDASGYAILEQGMNRVLETLTPILMIATIGAGILMLLFKNELDKTTKQLHIFAIVCAIIMVASTLSINAGINFAIDKWDTAAPPADWMQLRDKWEMGHLIRTIFGVFGLAIAQYALIFRR